MDYRAIARAITDPENQPHQFTDVGLAEFFLWAADEIDQYQKVLLQIKQQSMEANIREMAHQAIQQRSNK